MKNIDIDSDMEVGGNSSFTPKRTSRQQISLTITPELLAKVDELAARMGQSRAAVINMAIFRTVEATRDKM